MTKNTKQQKYSEELKMQLLSISEFSKRRSALTQQLSGEDWTEAEAVCNGIVLIPAIDRITNRYYWKFKTYDPYRKDNITGAEFNSYVAYPEHLIKDFEEMLEDTGAIPDIKEITNNNTNQYAEDIKQIKGMDEEG